MEDDEFDTEVVATKKGKRKVDDVEQSKRRSKGKEKEKETETVDDDVPTFFDSNYDLSDKGEDEIMAAQVQGWKNVVASMRVIEDRDEEASSDNLPTDTPSEGESEDDLGGKGDPDMPQVVSRRFKPATDFNDPRWEIGLRFNSKNDFKEVIRHEEVKEGKKLRLLKNDKIRCIAVCPGLERIKKRKAGCPWKITLAHRPTIGCWQISRLKLTHTCRGSSYNHGCANARFLSKYFKEDMRIFPGMTVLQFIKKVKCELKINISFGKAQRAMAQARNVIEGDVIRQYKRLHDYMAEIIRSNPGSTVKLATRRLSDGTEKFSGIYTYCGSGWMPPEGQGKGIPLTAIGLDPNDLIFPIAFAVVAVESTETWIWFLDFLVRDLEINDSSKWTFISDRQKGLINAVWSCCHMAEHLFCVWHMHNNFRKVFSSTTLKDKIWEAARATTEYAFDRVMDEIKQLNSGAHTWLTTHTSKEHWSRAFFSF
ncbi:uncharacterized protein LOC121800837 [Salvia splendens]|uniref:uncharacterized protein LOC121800837 n=1 Tax=Salvia splendens TaxID=180675 RepID=UPI001C2561E9|nr:uncharacterized protein LOC121800837 [Salvia splendens]